jgi:hypothetical protein
MSSLLPNHRLAIDALIRAASEDLCSESSSSSEASGSASASASASSNPSASSRSRLTNSSVGHNSFVHGSTGRQNILPKSPVSPRPPEQATTDAEAKNNEVRGNRSVTFDPEMAMNPDRSERRNEDGSSSSYAEEMDDDEEEDIEQTNSSGEMQDPHMKASRKGRSSDDAGVRRLRWAVLLLLVVSGVSISIATYFSLRDQQTVSYTQDVRRAVDRCQCLVA